MSIVSSKQAHRHRAAWLALAATVLMTGFKLAAGLVSGSIGVLSEGVHSALDVVSAAVAFVSIRAAGKPADIDHPYGHGKFETISSFFESVLLAAAGAWMVWEGVVHIREPHVIEHQGLAIAVLGISSLASLGMYRHNMLAAGVTESSAIHVNALHFLADSVAGIGVIAGLFLIRWTGWLWIDPLMAFGVAAYVISISYRQARRAFDELSDSQLPEEELARVRSILEDATQAGEAGQVLEAHDLRTRRAGATRHMDFHLVVCGALSVSRSHEVCDQLEERLLGDFPGASVTIHVEPCEHHRTRCPETCRWSDGKGRPA